MHNSRKNRKNRSQCVKVKCDPNLTIFYEITTAHIRAMLHHFLMSSYFQFLSKQTDTETPLKAVVLLRAANKTF